MKQRHGWNSVLEAATSGVLGEGNACCQIFQDGECCMTDRAREVFDMILAAGGPSLEECEALARGDLALAKVTP